MHGGERGIRTHDGVFDPITVESPALIELSEDCPPDVVICFGSARAFGQFNCSLILP
jgi:hypothetical protein